MILFLCEQQSQHGSTVHVVRVEFVESVWLVQVLLINPGVQQHLNWQYKLIIFLTNFLPQIKLGSICQILVLLIDNKNYNIFYINVRMRLAKPGEVPLKQERLEIYIMMWIFTKGWSVLLLCYRQKNQGKKLNCCCCSCFCTTRWKMCEPK